MQPLRILHSEAAVAFGGQEHRIFKEMHAMRARGHHIEAVCQPQAQLVPRLRDAGFTVHTVPMGGLVKYLKGVVAVRRILLEGNYDVVNTHSRIDTLIAGTAGRLAGTPLIVRTRHLASKVGSMLSYTWLPHRVTTVSEYVRRYLISRGVPAEHTATLYSPVVLPPPVEHSTLRGELGLAEDDIVVGCVAVMRAAKGHKSLIDAMRPLMATRPKLHMVFVGSGSPTFENTQRYIQELGLQDRIHLMGTRRDVPNLLAGFDLFALATEQEASGTVYVEAEAAGLPVIGTDVGGVSEMMRDGVTGILVPVHDHAALQSALERLIDNPELRRQMGEAGRRMVWEEGVFSPARLAENTEAIYRKWLAERRS
ncbi:glycosyltransferase family 4 protein [Bordetella genomosp. 4]|uniref:Glycosyltransferase family 1 protein n=1 Tax=Bordetella genomosp. 4 TaxID=463044 RepID=A0A261TX44_9BORD|nr:glycosyltransferase family 4 protein [Bordetella genomosp. 4]OZI47077.1 glycosyltransferase family 1 protein [Bordetella genomosp. 4]OZI54254.1 glycosyltransferase family 1 protein [Bordetella genomosp. 4]